MLAVNRKQWNDVPPKELTPNQNIHLSNLVNSLNPAECQGLELRANPKKIKTGCGLDNFGSHQILECHKVRSLDSLGRSHNPVPLSCYVTRA